MKDLTWEGESHIIVNNDKLIIMSGIGFGLEEYLMFSNLVQNIVERIYGVGIEFWQEIALAGGILIFFILARGFFTRVLFKWLLKLCRRTRTELDEKLLLAFEHPLRSLILLVGVYFALQVLPFSERFYATIQPLYRSLIIVFVTWGFYNLLDSNNFHGLVQKHGIDRILIEFGSKVIKVVLVALAGVTILQTWGYNVEGFIAGLGLGGLAFALAAQDTVANVFGGFVILIDKPFSVGDWIQTPSVEGTVEQVTFRSTKIRTFAQALVTVPNSVIANEALTNWSRMGKRRITFNLTVRKDTPPEKIKSCTARIQQFLENHPDVHKERILVRFNGFGESGLEILIYFFTITTVWTEYLAVKEDINLKILEILAEEDVKIAFTSRSIYLENQSGFSEKKGE